MEHEDLKELIGLLKDTDITELQVEKEGVKIKIKREKFFGHLEVAQPVMVERQASKDPHSCIDPFFKRSVSET